tara:strand:- start:10176 stop:11399 length:1224 start_codon:yes stop_codon:yes gene_type:complete
MNFSRFISKRIWNNNLSSFSSLISKIAIGGIVLGVTIILLSFFILNGFKNEIKNNVYSFSGHFNISKYTGKFSYKDNPLNLNVGLSSHLEKLNYVKYFQPYILSPILIKSNSDDIEGVLFKGVDKNFNSDLFNSKIINGNWLDFKKNNEYSNEIIISKNLQKVLNAKIGDDVYLYFANNPPVYRKLKLKGVFETGMQEFDNNFIFGDILLLRKIYNWNDSLVSGVEVFVENQNNLESIYNDLKTKTAFDEFIEKTDTKYIQVFDWLKLLDRNILIFFTLILFVASFNMISILLILIMERIRMIGILKALGSNNNQIKNIFLYNGLRLIFLGLFLGNLISIIFAVFQDKFKILKLDKTSYYMDYVPIGWDLYALSKLNLLILIVIFLVIFLPILVINRIKILDSIKFS